MRIKKLSHCCLVIDVATAGGSRRLLIDPGIYSLEQHDKLNHADIVLITHEHADHFHIESLKSLVKRSPEAAVITNDAVGEILAKEGIEHRVMRHGDAIDIKDIHIEAYGKDHALMHSSIPAVSNIGFFIQSNGAQFEGVASKNFFFPGDAFTDPNKEIDILALPVAGPWMKLSEAIDYALHIDPRMAFPVHDAVRFASQHILSEKILTQNGIEFVKLEEGGVIEA